MGEHGVAGLSLSEVARRIGLRRPSLYKYFPSKLAVYDALLARAASEVLAVFRSTAADAAPGLPALTAAVKAMSRWGLAHQVVGQLLFLRPVPGFTPSAEAYAPAVELVGQVRRLLQAAADRAQLHPAAATGEGEALLSILFAGMVTQQLANEPDAAYEQGRFTRLAPQLLHMFAHTYSPQE